MPSPHVPALAALATFAAVVVVSLCTKLNILAPQQMTTTTVVHRETSTSSADDGPSVSIAAILSGQRSSSTFLAYNVMSTMPCHISLNEPFFKDPVQSFDFWEVEAKELGFDHVKSAREVDPIVLAKFLLKVAKRKCQDKFDETPNMQQTCHNHCWVNYKHFSVHLAIWQHELLWNALLEELPLENFAMIVLERSVEERWKSTWFAAQTGDWAVGGNLKDHKKAISDSDIPPVVADFRLEHEQWYQMVRGYGRHINQQRLLHGQPTIPIVELKFGDVTRPYSRELIQEQIAKALGDDEDSPPPSGESP